VPLVFHIHGSYPKDVNGNVCRRYKNFNQPTNHDSVLPSLLLIFRKIPKMNLNFNNLCMDINTIKSTIVSKEVRDPISRTNMITQNFSTN
jgi:hypothetical protein